MKKIRARALGLLHLLYPGFVVLGFSPAWVRRGALARCRGSPPRRFPCTLFSSSVQPSRPLFSFNSFRHLGSLRCVHVQLRPVAPHQFYVIEQVPRRTWEPLLRWDFKKYLCGNSTQNVRTVELGLHLAHLLPALACER